MGKDRNQKKPKREELAPRHIDVLVAMFRLHQLGHKDFPYEVLASQCKKSVSSVQRIVSELRDYPPDIIKDRHVDTFVYLKLNREGIVTSKLLAQIILRLYEAFERGHVRRESFENNVAENEFYKNYEGPDKLDPEEIVNWLLLPEIAYAYWAREAPTTRIAISDRVWIEIEYLKRIAAT